MINRIGKRKMVLGFALVLALFCILLQGALADGVLTFDEGTFIEEVVPFRGGFLLIVNDQTLMPNDQTLWFWRPNQEAPTRISTPSPFSTLFAPIEGLLPTATGDLAAYRTLRTELILYYCTFDEGSQALSLAETVYITLPQSQEDSWLTDVFFQEDCLYLVFSNNALESKSLYAYDIHTRQEWNWPNLPFQRIYALEDEWLLGSQLQIDSAGYTFAECLRNRDLTPATVVDHIVPHRGDTTLFWDKKLATLMQGLP